MRVSWAWRDEIYHYFQGRASQHALLLLQDMVPWEVLNSRRRAICFDAMPGNPGLPFNVRICLAYYPWFRYDELTPVDEFMIQEEHTPTAETSLA
ncbi:hypothetical protein Y1Q_0006912 [Alligator mississippiensis]|uniref:Uncharacterized protein n=1 Tax=Alligator mississippiensis TaxID=8496 RepID=A0A151MUJ0_ALLMI|nr:hypothetical protein Y1Q_0006912 [Alligator mississippiensis]